jgi:hypothetical protein
MQRLAQTKNPGRDIKQLDETAIWLYESVWDYDMMYGCVCDPNFSGIECIVMDCPLGDDPLTGTVADFDGVQYNELQQVTCKATGGEFKLTFNKRTTEPIAFDAEIDTMTNTFNALPTVAGCSLSYAGIITVACTSLGNVITITFEQDFGDQPLVLIDMYTLVHASMVEDPVLYVRETQVGTKESVYCSDRGVCDIATGVCTCSAGWRESNGAGLIGNSQYNRGDCGHAFDTVSSCPGEVSCSGHGTCRGPPTYTCFCKNGWMGADCSEKVCTNDIAWFDEPIGPSVNPELDGMIVAHQNRECSSMGFCDRSKGECTCVETFEGASCQKMKCPGMPACNGHGTCVDMQEMARARTDNGDATDFTYGAIPLYPPTWDSNKIQGCLCDVGYEGYDCLQISCPTGDDPWTRGGNFEVQTVQCYASNGAFSLKFRQAITNNIDFAATEADIKASLEALPGARIGQVDVLFTKKLEAEVSGATDAEIAEQDQACRSDGSNVILIKFLTELGDLPDMGKVEDGVDRIDILTDGSGLSVKGTKENALCNDRGLCDFSTGRCKCFEGYSSSDGDGNEGERNDCGFMLAIYAGSMSEQQNTT